LRLVARALGRGRARLGLRGPGIRLRVARALRRLPPQVRLELRHVAAQRVPLALDGREVALEERDRVADVPLERLLVAPAVLLLELRVLPDLGRDLAAEGLGLAAGRVALLDQRVARLVGAAARRA
ncbi:unnamed protein product, partial [Pelagomonas calceolata]